MNNSDSHITPKPFSADEQDRLLLERIASLKQQIAKLKKQTADNTDAHQPPSMMLPHYNKAHLERFIHSNIVPVMRTFLSGETVDCNEAFAKLLGFEQSDFGVGKLGWKELTPPEWLPLDAAAVEILRQGKKVEPWEKEYYHKNGTTVPVIIAIDTPASISEENLVFVYDLTDRKKAEAQLKASESQFRVLAEVIPQIVWVTDSNGKTKYCNHRFYEATGLEKERENGYLWMEALQKEDQQTFLEAARACRALESPFELKVRYRLKNGEYHWHLFRAMPLKGLDTKNLEWFGTATDIDDQVKFEESLRQSQAKFRILADAIPQIVWSADNRGEIDFFNLRWFEYTGLSLEQSQNNGWQLLIHPDDLSEYMRKWRQCLLTGETYEMEFRLKPAVGFATDKDRSGSGYRWHLARAVALRDPDGRISKWFATWTKIESQKKS